MNVYVNDCNCKRNKILWNYNLYPMILITMILSNIKSNRIGIPFYVNALRIPQLFQSNHHCIRHTSTWYANQYLSHSRNRSCYQFFSTTSSSSSSSSSKTPSINEQMIELKKLIHDSQSFTKRNQSTLSKSTKTPQQIQTLISDLEKESSDQNFWNNDTQEQTQRRKQVHDQLSYYNQLKSTLELWDQCQNDIHAALELMDMENDNMDINNDIDTQQMLLQECHDLATLLLQSNQAFELKHY